LLRQMYARMRQHRSKHFLAVKAIHAALEDDQLRSWAAQSRHRCALRARRVDQLQRTSKPVSTRSAWLNSSSATSWSWTIQPQGAKMRERLAPRSSSCRPTVLISARSRMPPQSSRLTCASPPSALWWPVDRNRMRHL